VGLASSYASALCVLVLIEWAVGRYLPTIPLGPTGVDFLKDAVGFFITAQAGILSVLAVAIGVVTLLTQKDDGSAVNPDVRLYYEESFSYQIATSSVLLLAVLVLQLFWPFEPFVARATGGKALDHFKLCVTALHALWLVLNLYLFLHFFHTTLRFVQPQARGRLREQYSASQSIPSDIRERLTTAYYNGLGELLLGEEETKQGPLVTFRFGLIAERGGQVEITRFFKTPLRLVDVWLLPLGFALRSWIKRTRSAAPTPKGNDPAHYEGQLAILVDFDRVYDDAEDLVMREGAVPLTRIERFLINVSLRFVPIKSRTEPVPTPSDFIQQLVFKLVGQIEAGSPNGFNAALREVVAYHRFVLSAQNTRAESGERINLAQVGDFFKRPDFEWLREYRRAYTAAVGRMTTDGYFVHGMSRLVVLLWPSDPEEYPASVLTNLLELGRNQVAIFEAWLTGRALVEGPEGVAPGLARLDQRAYDDALVNFVTAWETLQQLISGRFEVRRRSRLTDNEVYWENARASWPSLQTHLRNTAYFLAAAVWNEDLTGSDRYRDLLVRWIQSFYAQLQQIYPFRDTLMLTPDVLQDSWTDAQAEAARTLIYQQPPSNPATIYALVLRAAYYDALAITGAVLLHWHANGFQPSAATAETALATLERRVLPGSGNTLLDANALQKPIFRLVFDLLFRESLRSRRDEVSYSAYLAGLIQILNEMSAARMVPGRIYGGFTLDGVQTLTPTFLAIMAGNLPLADDGTIAELVQRLLVNFPRLEDDQTLRDLVWAFEQYAGQLDGEPDAPFITTFRLFQKEADPIAARARLKSILQGVVDAIAARRIARIREAPLDAAKVETVRAAVTDALLGEKRPWAAFAPADVSAVSRADIATLEEVRGVVDRGVFTTPAFSPMDVDAYLPFFVENAQTTLQNTIFRGLMQREKRRRRFNVNAGVGSFYRKVLAEAADPNLGEELAVLVPDAPFGEPLYMTTAGFPDPGLEGFDVTVEPALKGTGTTRYLATINGVHVYAWHARELAVLCARSLLQSVHFGRLAGTDRIYDFELFDDGDPTKSQMRYRMAPEVVWEDRLIVEFQIIGLQLPRAR
jgi:hypothetical protein